MPNSIRSGSDPPRFQLYVEMLTRQVEHESRELEATRGLLVRTTETAEGFIADLMAVSDAVRRHALATFSANAGAVTDDGARIARLIKVGRNDQCPCGSGKKWKKCCGIGARLQ